MTSRPAQPGQRPQPQRSLSGSGMLQRQAQQRSHLNNLLGTPGSSRHNVVDLTNEPRSSTPSRPGAPFHVASGLRLETIAEVRDATPTAEAQQQSTSPWPVAQPPWPRGKPKLMFSFQNPTQSQDDTASPATSFAGSVASPQKYPMPKPPLSFPPRPVRRAPPARDRSSELANAVPAHKKDKVPRPYVLEVPSVGPTCPSKFSLDFFPWTGGQPEDKFSAAIITHGYFDKLQISSDKEVASLIPVSSGKNQQSQSAASPFKQPQSLKALSNFFTGVLEARRNYASITAPSTFRPPPRVTLTDTKKETWLKDLANPSIPLRRLSRTIPHGIKNKVLLEQCMDKDVPIERAVWLAKCVGANEIRASKRTKGAPGAGGEAKWIRDWTVCVEQFVESTITLCGEAAHKVDGKSKLMYCIRLSSYLFSEQLLDSAHYLDYILASLESSNTAKLPARLFIAGVHSQYLLQYRKTGHRYVAALCIRLQIMHKSPDRDILVPAIDKSGSILKSLITAHPESLFASKKWPLYKTIIKECIAYLGPEAEQALEMIDRRNSRLSRGVYSHHSLQGPRREVIKLLDSTQTIPFTSELGKACWKAMNPRAELAQTVLEWATSRHRPGAPKVFVAARLLRIWSRHNLDVNEAALDFVSRASQSTTISSDSFYHLYSELSRSGHFSVAKYIHWLIARGGLRSKHDAEVDGPVATRLLAELPLCNVPESLLRLRKALLHRASFEVEEEGMIIEEAWGAVEARLPSIDRMLEDDPVVTSIGVDIIHNMNTMSRTVKAELGLRLRQLVKSSSRGSDAEDSPPPLTTEDFFFIRSVLEQSGDIAMLADVLKLVSSATSSTPATLSACADTVNVHRDSLAAIGAFRDLFETLGGRYRTISLAHGSGLATLRASLCDLSAKIPEARELYIELAKEIAWSMHKGSVEACSPVSDHVVEVLQKSEGGCSDEIEKLLDSGSSMDHTTFVRLFEVLVSQIEALWTKEAPDVQRHTALMGRLRTFETKHFCSMLTIWLDDVIQRSQRPSITHIFGPLISSDCVSFGDVLKSCAALLQGKKALAPAISGRIALETLGLALGSARGGDTLQSGDSYKLNIKRKHAQEAYHTTILDITRHIIEMKQPFVEGEADSFTALCGERPFVDFLQRLVIVHFDVITNSLVVPLAKSQDIGILTRLRILLRSLLDLATPQTPATDPEPANRIAIIIGVASDFTLPFCQLALRSVFAGEPVDNMVAGGDMSTSPMQAFETAINQALAAGNTTWTSLLSMLDAAVARHLFESAERGIVTNLLATGPEEEARQKLFIVQATAYSMHGHRDPAMAALLAEKVNDVVRHVTSGHGQQQLEDIQHLPFIVEIINVLSTDLDGMKQAAEIQAGLLVILASLHLHLKSKQLGTEELRQMIFDTIISLADDLDDSTRMRCVSHISGSAPVEQATPAASQGTPATHSGNFASTPGKEKTAMSPAQSSFHITPAPISASAPGTAAADPELCFALSFGKNKGTGLMLMQRGKMIPFQIKRWESLSEPTPIVGENDTALSMRLFEARKS